MLQAKKQSRNPSAVLFVIEGLQEVPRPGGGGVCEKGFRVCAFLHHFAVFKEENSVSNGPGEVHLVGDDDHGAAR